MADRQYPGLDYVPDRKWLVSAASVSWCFDADERTIRRWSRDGRMPPPVKIGKSVRWDADVIREWIKQGCPTWEEMQRSE